MIELQSDKITKLPSVIAGNCVKCSGWIVLFLVLAIAVNARAGDVGRIRFWGEAGLDAYVDGKKLGVTKKKPDSFVVEDLLVGKHVLKAQRPGFKAIEKTIDLEAHDTYLFKIEEEKHVIEDLKLELLPVKPGKYLRGSPADEKHRPERICRETQHEVTLTKPFWFGRTELTQAQYKAITGKDPSKFKGDDRPVEMVTWLDVYKYCIKLTEREKKAGRLPKGMVYRLPTSAEWEYAARAGSVGPYPFKGDSPYTLMNYAWYSRYDFRRKMFTKDELHETKPVGTKKPNAWGFYNMYGNVTEFCYDLCLPHTKEPKIDPTWPKADLEEHYFKYARLKIMGGHFSSNQRGCRVAGYGPMMPKEKNEATGLRLVLGFPLRKHHIPKNLLDDDPKNDDDE